MLEYTKLILQKVSFNRELFTKELKKSFKWLTRKEALILYYWCILTFGHLYGDVIKDTFSSIIS